MVNEKISDIDKLVIPKDHKKFQWIDRAKTIMDLATRVGIAYVGYNAAENVAKGSGLGGVLVSQLALRLADSSNVASGAAGVASLAALGILNVAPAEDVFIMKPIDDFFAGFVDLLWRLHPASWVNPYGP